MYILAGAYWAHIDHLSIFLSYMYFWAERLVEDGIGLEYPELQRPLKSYHVGVLALGTATVCID